MKNLTRCISLLALLLGGLSGCKNDIRLEDIILDCTDSTSVTEVDSLDPHTWPACHSCYTKEFNLIPLPRGTNAPSAPVPEGIVTVNVNAESLRVSFQMGGYSWSNAVNVSILTDSSATSPVLRTYDPAVSYQEVYLDRPAEDRFKILLTIYVVRLDLYGNVISQGQMTAGEEFYKGEYCMSITPTPCPETALQRQSVTK